MSRLIPVVLVVALIAAGAGCSRDDDTSNDLDRGQAAGDAAFATGTRESRDLDVQEFESQGPVENANEAPDVATENFSDHGSEQPVQGQPLNESGDQDTGQPNEPIVGNGYVTYVFSPIPAATGTVVMNGASDTSRTIAGDNTDNETFRAFWSFDLSKIRSTDVQQATLQFTHKETVGDPFRLDNLNLGLGIIRVWLVQYDQERLPKYGRESIREVDLLTTESLRESPTEFDLTLYVARIGERVASDDLVQVMAGFQRNTNNDHKADYVEWESVVLTVTYAPTQE